MEKGFNVKLRKSIKNDAQRKATAKPRLNFRQQGRLADVGFHERLQLNVTLSVTLLHRHYKDLFGSRIQCQVDSSIRTIDRTSQNTGKFTVTPDPSAVT